MTPSLPSLVCTGCGATVAGALAFRCPNAAHDARDHVLARSEPPTGSALAAQGDPNPFVRYRTLSYSWHLARARGLSDHDYTALVRELDRAVAGVDGHGFAITPYRSAPTLAGILGLGENGVWIKDETANVSGSHKARHLFGLAVHLAVAERTGMIPPTDSARSLAIASCGNAALAAAVVARAARRRLRVFVPTWAEAPVIAGLTMLGAVIEVCPRRASDPPGDPCHHRFREAVGEGAVPFCVQGSDNGLTIDGGMTLGLELAMQSVETPIDRLMIQTGGGALASSVIQALAWAHDLDALPRLPAIHAVQTAGGFPVIRAWRRLARALVTELGGVLPPAADHATDADAVRADAASARWLAEHLRSPVLDSALRAAAFDRARYMWPWESAPVSRATGILDDETYDWLAVVRGMLSTGGFPVIASESNILEAYCEARGAGVQASATGAAGLAGAMTLAQAGLLETHDHAAILFTGVDR